MALGPGLDLRMTPSPWVDAPILRTLPGSRSTGSVLPPTHRLSWLATPHAPSSWVPPLPTSVLLSQTPSFSISNLAPFSMANLPVLALPSWGNGRKNWRTGVRGWFFGVVMEGVQILQQTHSCHLFPVEPYTPAWGRCSGYTHIDWGRPFRAQEKTE